MIHPSYVELMKAVNDGAEFENEPVVNSRYSIVIAASRRARQIIAGDEPLVNASPNEKPLSIAVREIYEGKVKILTDDAVAEAENKLARQLAAANTSDIFFDEDSDYDEESEEKVEDDEDEDSEKDEDEE
ncbi:MAG: DNA-directed RNA polymerase subunit omega [Lachnospiraceae bacterium]|nr:DNA-directed RNA polymerase subunit omega [Lachnospiraceae bacterium]